MAPRADGVSSGDTYAEERPADDPCNASYAEEKGDSPDGAPPTLSLSIAPKKKKFTEHRARLGRLRFGAHGICGALSTVLLVACLASSPSGDCGPDGGPPRPVLLAATIGCTSAAALSSIRLLPQVPRSTRIRSWIVPPHREAFRRTVAVVGYLNLRLASGVLRSLVSGGDGPRQAYVYGRLDLAVALLLAAYHTCAFFPFGADWANGNTWIFIVPIWLGIGVDVGQQFPRLSDGADGTVRRWAANPAASWELMLSPSSAEASWDGAQSWNNDIVTQKFLLVTMLCTVLVAFLFTLAFRAYVDIRTCYWVSAAVVAALAARVCIAVCVEEEDDFSAY